MPQKTIIFSVGHFPTKSETFVTNQIVLAIKLGYEVSIVVNKKHSLQNSSQPELVKRYDLLKKTKELKRIKVAGHLNRLWKIISLVFKGAPFKAYKTFNFFKYGKQGLKGLLFFQCYEIKDYLKADLFHIQFGLNAYPFDNLKKFNLISGKIITTFHGYDVHFTEDTKEIIKTNYHKLFSVGNIYTANTKYLANQLFELGCPKNKTRVIPMAIDSDFFAPLSLNNNKGKRRIKLISVGRLIKLKGFEFGIKSVAELIQKGYNLSYHILGEGEEREYLQKLIHQLKLENDVILQGAKTQTEIRKSLQESDIFLMTSSYDETGRREAQGIVTGEAQACELPVVAFRSGGVPYTIDEGITGFLSDENDYKDMAKNIERLIINEELRNQMSKNARDFIIKNYSQSYLNTRWENLYLDLLGP